MKNEPVNVYLNDKVVGTVVHHDEGYCSISFNDDEAGRAALALIGQGINTTSVSIADEKED